MWLFSDISRALIRQLTGLQLRAFSELLHLAGKLHNTRGVSGGVNPCFVDQLATVQP